MEFLPPIFSALSSISTQFSLYIALSPLCSISSSLYASVLDLPINDQTFLLMLSLAVVWGGAAVGVLHLMRTRTSKCIFFY